MKLLVTFSALLFFAYISYASATVIASKMPPVKCPPENQCGKNEEYSTCGTACPDTCDNMDDKNRICTLQCVVGCFCKKGYVRNKEGSCVLPSQCPPKSKTTCKPQKGPTTKSPVDPKPTKTVAPSKTTRTTTTCKPTKVATKTPKPTLPVCGLNEEYSSSEANECQNTCENPKLALVCKGKCVAGCICKKGYLRNGKGKCVLIENCDCKKPNEIYSKCGNHGCQNTCEEPDLLPRCSYAAGCYPGCICKPGYLRNNSGDCVPEEQCKPKCSGVNEEYQSCGTACPDTCDNMDDKDRVCTANCVAGCFCKAGFVRNCDGVCVLPEECPKKCAANEVFLTCGTACPKTCDNKDTVIACTKNCVMGCFCVDGYVRDKNNVCIKESDCPPKCPSNEEYTECGNHGCLNTCAEPDKTTYCDPKPGCYPGCICKEGYLRNSQGVCVLKKDCEPLCDMNEEYNSCGTCDCTCEICPVCPEGCNRGCFCKQGYVRDKDGKCILVKDCPIKCPLNEAYSDCGTACPKTCENRNTTIVCTEQCVKGCFCVEGYVRDKNNVCIPESECPKPCGCNEEYSECGANGCQNTCEYPTLGRGCKAMCVAGCVCKEGYLRNSKWECVLIDNCDCQKPNEIYSRCDNHACQNTCEKPDLITRCTYATGCYPGCICSPGYLRNSSGDCVPEEQCKPKCSGVNEEYQSCGTACPDTCDNMDDKNRPCPAVCVAGCFCKAGFVRNSDGVCVLPEECPKKCAVNEVYLTCGTACPKTCDNKDTVIACTKNCVMGCFCVDGYVRDKNNVCIKESDCPQKTTCKPTTTKTTCKPTTTKTTCKPTTTKTTCKPTATKTTRKPPTTCKPKNLY